MQEEIFIADLDGKVIQSEDKYFSEIWRVFCFPRAEFPNWPGYDDWITDLDWLNASGYALFIYQYQQFLMKDLKTREYVMNSFRDYILPFWEDEVTRVVVDGKAKPFNVYLVD